MDRFGELLEFLGEVASWTCRPCGAYGTGFDAWSLHRTSSPECADDERVSPTGSPTPGPGEAADAEPDLPDGCSCDECVAGHA